MTPAAEGYREPIRTYRSIGWTVLAVVVLVCFDLLIGGVHSAVTHLPGWLIVLAVLVGVHALVLHAARTTHSLEVTADRLVVGDDAVARADVTAARVGVLDPELTTLGWPRGFPRGSKGVTLTLADGSQLLVPTRDPERLRAVLTGAGRVGTERTAADPRPAPVAVRVADEDELAGLADLDARAEALFRVAGYDLSAVAPADEPDAVITFVAQRPPAGFAVLCAVDGDAYLHELAVLPRAMRRGIGTALLEHACAWALEAGYPAMTLTTFANVPWNAPFYAARGFTELALPGPQLAAIRDREIGRGLDAVAPRLVMRRALSPTSDAAAPSA